MFEQLDDTARIWVFMCDKDLTAEQQSTTQQGVLEFLSTWEAHGVPVQGHVSIVYDRFLIVAADQASSQVSGCSIDSLFRSLSEIVEQAGVRVCGHSTIFFRADGQVISMERGEFERFVSEGKVGPKTTVFNNAVQTLGELRSGKWELAYEDSWHATRFPLPEQQAAK